MKSETKRLKVVTGSFYTVGGSWLVEPVREFIKNSLTHFPSVLDPFAGDGHLLEVCQNEFGCDIGGFDIKQGKWEINDSLVGIPIRSSQMIVTNPPYLAKNSATRKGVGNDVSKYFLDTQDSDLYQVALRKCLNSTRFVVAIVPETFILSTFPKHSLVSVSVIEDNPFGDTDVPICVACFDTTYKWGETDAKIYKGNDYCATLGEIKQCRTMFVKCEGIRFNNPNGQIGLRAIDGSVNRIEFMASSELNYPNEKIGVSSRVITKIFLDGVGNSELPIVIKTANSILEELRSKSFDLILSPFKGNTKSGVRRRRLDYALAKGIISTSMMRVRVGCGITW